MGAERQPMRRVAEHEYGRLVCASQAGFEASSLRRTSSDLVEGEEDLHLCLELRLDGARVLLPPLARTLHVEEVEQSVLALHHGAEHLRRL